ncbi:transcriptional repressor TCF25-domain-containing protein [Pilobolus umbonatus]|nr:transcriptional repressor TCF25-domain-containing protein [Pilobolus umbonatus]
MSTRALRKLQKIQSPVSVSRSDSEEDVVEEKVVKQINPFDLLNEGNEEEEEEEESIEEIEEEKPVIKSITEKPPSKNSKKKNKKKKGKYEGTPAKKVEDISMKELDKVLKDMNKKSNANSTANSTSSDVCRDLLSVNYRYLDAEAEMKRLFGSHVVNTENRVSHQRTLKKSKFTTPKSEWPPYKRNGLSMELTENKDGISYYTYKHSEHYQSIQVEFLQAITTHSPDALLFIIRRHPYHIDSLVQLSEIAKHSGDWTAAGDFIERALYSCERGFHPTFQFNSGSVRLSYQHSENRPFFLAVFRHIQFLARRGCWKTAFEFNKLLLSLDPVSDPLGALLSLDYHALSARDYEYVIKMHSTWKNDGNLYPVHLADMPNFAFSVGYAKFKLVEKSKNESVLEESNKLIKDAIKKYPLLYCRLLEKLGEPETKRLGSLMKKMPNSYLDVIQLSYIERTSEMWKQPEVLQWLKKNGDEILDDVVGHPESIQKSLLCKQKDHIPLSVSRYIVLTDVQRLMSYLPSEVTSQSYQMYDPLPPADSITSYNLMEQLQRSTSRRGPGMMNMLANMFNDMPGNINYEALLNQVAQGRIPGAFPGGEEDEEDEEEDDHVQQNRDG